MGLAQILDLVVVIARMPGDSAYRAPNEHAALDRLRQSRAPGALNALDATCPQRGHPRESADG
jgi:hypothetical protein